MHENLTHNIEQYILELLEEEEENFISLRRKELAEKFECVPSQINYVLRSRFSPEHGYLIESRRGEYGYIRILKVSCRNSEEKSNHIEDTIGERIKFNDAKRLLSRFQKRGFITDRERLLMEISLHHNNELIYESENPEETKETMNAELLKRMLKGLMLI